MEIGAEISRLRVSQFDDRGRQRTLGPPRFLEQTVASGHRGTLVALRDLASHLSLQGKVPVRL